MILLLQIFIIMYCHYNYIYNVNLSHKNQDLRGDKTRLDSQIKNQFVKS